MIEIFINENMENVTNTPDEQDSYRNNTFQTAKNLPCQARLLPLLKPCTRITVYRQNTL